jgi:hypothetical protein
MHQISQFKNAPNWPVWKCWSSPQRPENGQELPKKTVRARLWEEDPAKKTAFSNRLVYRSIRMALTAGQNSPRHPHQKPLERGI